MNAIVLNADLVRGIESAFRAAGWTEDEVRRLSNPDMAWNLRQVLMGRGEVRPFTHLIENGAPMARDRYDGWTVREHRTFETFVWHPSRVTFFRSIRQFGGRIDGNKLRLECTHKPVLNSCVLDYLLANPHLIPEEWKDKTVLFMGTVLEDPRGNLAVRCLRWNPGATWTGSGWFADHHWLVRDVPDNAAVALLGD